MIADLSTYCPRHPQLVKTNGKNICESCKRDELAKAAGEWAVKAAMDPREALRVRG